MDVFAARQVIAQHGVWEMRRGGLSTVRSKYLPGVRGTFRAHALYQCSVYLAIDGQVRDSAWPKVLDWGCLGRYRYICISKGHGKVPVTRYGSYVLP